MQRRLLVFVGCLFLAACGGGGGGTPKCVPGQSIACVGAGPCDGNQICMPNGTYAACICGGTGTAGTSGGGGRGGTSGGGGALGVAGFIGPGSAGVFGNGGTFLTGGRSGTAGSSGATGSAGTGGAAGSAAGAAGGGGSTATAGTVGTGGGAAGTTGAAGAAGTTAGSGAGSGGRGGAAGAVGGAGTGGSLVCNPVAQTGCTTGQRCTWVVTGTNTGHNACLADGSVNLGGACTYGAVGETTGFDNCKKGTSCLSGICKTICSQVPDSCPTNYACDLYANSPFNLDGTTGVGFCDSTCDPLTQARDSDGATACGSANPSAPTLGCYGPINNKFLCAPSGAATKTQGVAAGMPAYVNSCAPGFSPIVPNDLMSSAPICTAFCKPADTSAASPGNAGGQIGSGFTCADKGAAAPHECRYYWWMFEDFTATGYTLSKYSNTLGQCFNYPNYKYDSNGDRVLDTTLPSCTTLSTTAHTFDSTLTDAQAWGCTAHP